MNKHTSGPWSIGNANLKEEAEVGIHGPGPYGFVICDMSADGYDEDTQKANARLIAAAPDLLDALEAMVFGAGAVAVHHEGERKALQMAVDIALAAIAKARGES